MQTYQDKWITIPLKNDRDKMGRFISRKTNVQFDWEKLHMQTNQIVKLKLPLLTLTNSFQKGDKFKVLGYHGTLLRLSQVNSRKKLITIEENVEVVNK